MVFFSETFSETKLRRTAIYGTRVHARAELRRCALMPSIALFLLNPILKVLRAFAFLGLNIIPPRWRANVGSSRF